MAYTQKCLGIILLSLIIFFSSCRRDLNYAEGSVDLKFSSDTVMFDTVFTTIGSATKYLKIYNPLNEWIKINDIRLAGGTNSMFKINVDGTPGTSFSDIDLAPKDSMYILLKVTINPNNQNNPFIISDSIIFSINNQIKDIDLIAFGQNAYYHTPKPNLFIKTGKDQALFYSYANCKSHWKNDKPHIIYGYTVVDTDSTLTIDPGARIYFHKNAVLWIYDGGTLKVNEGATNPNDSVVFQGDRLESFYRDKSGQWGGIWLSPGSINNVINYAVIKNGVMGIQVDTVGASTAPTLKLTNTIIQNMSSYGILAQESYIQASNCVISNCGQSAIALTIGGYYEFNHCTIGNYYTASNRQTPALLLNNYYKDQYGVTQVRNLEKAFFGNCIIYGSLENEIGFDNYGIGMFNYTFDHSLIKIDPKENTNTTNYISILKNVSDPTSIFKSNSSGDFRLGTSSPAIDKGDVNIGNIFPIDIKGNSRISDGKPDMGAYEYK